MHHKKLIPGFVCRDGKTFSLLGHPFCDSAEELGLFSGSTGADALLFADGSRTDEDHEAVIGALRKTVRAAGRFFFSAFPRSGIHTHYFQFHRP